MRKSLVLALGLMVVPTIASAQVELGLDFFGISYTDVDGAADAEIGASFPVSGMRVAFPAGPQILIETRIEGDWSKQGDASGKSLDLLPGINYLVNDQVYVRGEAGLSYGSFDTGTVSGSSTQYLFGGAVGMRRPLGMGILRLEAGVLKALENTDDGIPSWMQFNLSAGASVVVN
jgi:hypothetical protein